MSKVIRLLLLLLVPPLAVAITPTASWAGAERISADGIGAQAVFASVDQIDGRAIRTSTKVFVSAPSDGAPLMGVTVEAVDTRSGAIGFAGTAYTQTLGLEIGPHFDNLHLTGNLSVHNSLGSDERAVEVNVVWNSAGDFEPLGTVVAVIEDGRLTQESYSGSIRSMRATAVVSVSNPATPGHTTTATIGDPAAVVWDTSASARLLTSGKAVSSSTASSNTGVRASATSTTTSGHWTGYWTWNAQTQSWYWTWVWVPN